MTNKGVESIKESLTIFEEEKIKFTENGSSVPWATIYTDKYLLGLVDFLIEHKDFISTSIRGGEPAVKDIPADKLASMWIVHQLEKLGKLSEIITMFPMDYPLTRLRDKLAEGAEQHQAAAEKHGIARI